MTAHPLGSGIDSHLRGGLHDLHMVYILDGERIVRHLDAASTGEVIAERTAIPRKGRIIEWQCRPAHG